MFKLDRMICDQTFRAIRDKLAVIVGWTKPPNQNLPEWALEETRQVSEQRGSYEQNLSDLTDKFNFMKGKHQFVKNKVKIA